MGIPRPRECTVSADACQEIQVSIPAIAGMSPGNDMDHTIDGKPLADCTLAELSDAGAAGEWLSAQSDNWSAADSERLTAIWRIHDEKADAMGFYDDL